VIHNTRFWAYNTRSETRKNSFIEVMLLFVSLETEMAAVFTGVTGEKVNLINHDIKTFKYTQEFFKKLAERLGKEDPPKELSHITNRLIDLCYQSHAKLSMK